MSSMRSKKATVSLNALFFLTVLGGCGRLNKSPPAAQPNAGLAITLSPPVIIVRNLNDSAHFSVTFDNRGKEKIVLPVGRILLDENLHVRLFSSQASDPFAKHPLDDLQRMPPFQGSSDEMIVLKPGESHELQFESLSWMRLINYDSETKVNGKWRATGDWLMRAGYTGKFPESYRRELPVELRSLLPMGHDVLSNTIVVRVQ
jgi:hypothetical protein